MDQGEKELQGEGELQDEIGLIRRAKEGDREAWARLCAHYYPRWVRGLHGDLGETLRRLQDTQDVVHSALASALEGLGELRNDGAFYAWVTAIIRRKVAQTRRRVRRAREVPIEDAGGGVPDPRGPAETPFGEDEHDRLLDAILALFETHPESMAAIYLKYFEKMDIPHLTEALGKSERTVQRLLVTGKELLRLRLERE
jgi:RNA polymerase sigma factor (sigma-70 family)